MSDLLLIDIPILDKAFTRAIHPYFCFDPSFSLPGVAVSGKSI